MIINHPIPKPLSAWRHHNGRHYIVITVANLAATDERFPVIVVYRDSDGPHTWARPLSEWHQSFTEVTI